MLFKRDLFADVFHGFLVKEDGDELSMLTPTRGWGGATRTGLHAKVLVMPASVWEFPFGGTVFGFSLVCFLGASH